MKLQTRILVGLVGGVLIGIVGGVYPAWRAAHVSPARTLAQQ